MPQKTLIVLLGPTGIGKTELSLHLAEHLGCPILNCDSRQIYRGIEIGTAAPTQEEQARVKHYFVGKLNLNEYYSAAQYEAEALQLLDTLFTSHDRVLLSGGSMLYIDAVCKGIDDIPTVDSETRQLMKERLQKDGLDCLLEELRLVDPAYYAQVDKHNTQRIVHALEVYYMTGHPFSSFRTQSAKQRPFRVLKIGLQRPREELFIRINERVDKMMQDGLLDEVKRNLHNRYLNALNTVGFKELFTYLDTVKDNEGHTKSSAYIPRQKGELRTLNEAIERIKKNTRVYAKKQMTWFAKDDEINWFHPSQTTEIMKLIEQ